MLAKNALDRGLAVKSYIKTSLCPGTGLVCQYLNHGNIVNSLQQLRSASTRNSVVIVVVIIILGILADVFVTWFEHVQL